MTYDDVYLDFRKTFGSVSDCNLLIKFKSYGIGAGNCLIACLFNQSMSGSMFA